jgi:putative endonuclease
VHLIGIHISAECRIRASVIPAEAGIHTEGTVKTYYLYILASGKNGTIYIGMTNDLLRRVHEHKHNMVAGFTAKYDVHMLVYYEMGGDVRAVIEREKQLKKWNRQWKINLIEKANPTWRDLYPELVVDQQ